MIDRLFEKIESFEDNWDGEGSLAPTKHAIERAKSFIIRIIHDLKEKFGVKTPFPYVFPGIDGVGEAVRQQLPDAPIQTGRIPPRTMGGDAQVRVPLHQSSLRLSMSLRVDYPRQQELLPGGFVCQRKERW